MAYFLVFTVIFIWFGKIGSNFCYCYFLFKKHIDEITQLNCSFLIFLPKILKIYISGIFIQKIEKQQILPPPLIFKIYYVVSSFKKKKIKNLAVPSYFFVNWCPPTLPSHFSWLGYLPPLHALTLVLSRIPF